MNSHKDAQKKITIVVDFQVFNPDNPQEGSFAIGSKNALKILTCVSEGTEVITTKDNYNSKSGNRRETFILLLTGMKDRVG